MLAWIDLETTGLDYRKERLLEAALVVTDDELNELAAEQGWVKFDRADPAYGCWTGKIDPYVVEMHTKNGLWVDCASETAEYCDRLETRLLEALKRYAPEAKTVPMCGSTIGFDRAFLREWMPRLEAHFHYRNVDVSSIGELARRWYFDAWDRRPRGDAHRALADIRQSIELARYWRSEIMR